MKLAECIVYTKKQVFVKESFADVNQQPGIFKHLKRV